MSKVLLINPSHRPKRRKARKSPSAAQRRARAAFAARARGRAKNPVRRVARRRHVAVSRRRRRNPIHALATRRTSVRRRRNPISMGVSTRGIVGQLKAALVGGAGAVAMDVIMGQINKYLPASMQATANVGVGDAVKAGVTVLLGQVLNKMSRGMSSKLAQGALTVQAADILRSFVPSTMTVGYYSPGRVIRGSPKTGPNMQAIAPGMARYLAPAKSGGPLLSRYMSPGSTQLLSASGMRTNSNVRAR